MSRLPDESVDLVVTSPPYNLGICYGKYSDTQDRQSYSQSCGESATPTRRVLKPTGSVFLITKSGCVELNRVALGVPYQDKSNIARWSHSRGKDLRCRGNTWFVPYETIQSREKERPHPATFPVQLAEWCIKLHGPAGAGRIETMLDPFLGIGNSAVAAQLYPVKRFIGFEIDETYLV